MPEYVTPGISIEEGPFRSRRIEGVDSSTTGFVGLACAGPDDRPSPPLHSLAEFEREYGDGSSPLGGRSRAVNYLWHAARAFFANGGRRLHVARVRCAGETPPRAADYAAALARLEELPEIAVVAAPGAPFADEVLAHAARVRDRFALLDPPPSLDLAQVRAWRAPLDSRNAALYYPWVTAEDPASGHEVHLPPSGFVAGVYARVDAARGVRTSPADEPLHLATALERDVTRQEQEILNPEGISCLRHMPERGGVLIWGARTISSEPEWKYVAVRRLFLFLEASIERGTRWVVFEPNGEPLWAAVRREVESFLLQQWRAGALVGSRADEAFFVRCDRTTMTRSDIDNGRLVCLVGVAPVRPAEFVILRIGQPTADRTPPS